MKSFLKKVSLYALGGLAIAGTFTSCIDNDAPAGVEEMRHALSQLLLSKSGLAEASAAQQLANAELAKAEAELIRAQAEVQKAIAEYQRALAAGEQAKAEQILQQIEAQRAIDQANLELLIAQNKQAITEAEIAAQKALAQWEIDKAGISLQVIAKLQPYYTAYFNALDAYQAAYYNYLAAVEAQVANFVSGGTWVGGVWIPDAEIQYDNKMHFQDAVATANQDVEEAQAVLDILNNALAEMPTEPSAMGQLYDKYNAMDKALGDSIIALNIAKDQAHVDNPLFEQKEEATQELNQIQQENITIEEFTYELTADQIVGIPNVAGVLGATNDELIFPETTYTYNTLGIYDTYKNNLEWRIARLKAYYLDENDQEWTQVRINELKKEEKTLSATVDALTVRWQSAVDAFNMGAEPKLDKLLNEKELKAAVAGYNTAAKAYNDYLPTYATDLAAKNAALTAANDALTDLQNEIGNGSRDQEAETTKDNAIEKAREDKVAAYEAADAISDQITANNEALQAKQDALVVLDQKQTAAAAAYAADQTAANLLALGQAVAAYNEAYTELNGDGTPENPGLIATTTQKNDELRQEQIDAYNAADDAYSEAFNAAWTAYWDTMNDIWSSGNNLTAAEKQQLETAQAAIDAAQAAVDAVNDTLNKKAQAAQDAFVKFDEERENQIESYRYPGYNNVWGSYNDAWNTFVNEYNVVATGGWVQVDGTWDWHNPWDGKVNLPAKATVEMGPFAEDLKELVIETSHQLYGYSFNADRNNDTQYPNNIIENAQLKPLTQEIVDQMIAAALPDLKIYEYPNYYTFFGAFGKLIYNQNRQEVAAAVKDNTALIDEVIAPLQAQLDKVEAQFDAVDSKVEELNATLKDVNAQIAAIDQEYNNAIALVQARQLAVQTLTGYITNNVTFPANVTITQMSDITDFLEGNYTAENLVQYKDALEEAIDTANDNLATAEKALAKAQYLLEAYEKGEVALEELFKIQLEELAAQVEVLDQKVQLAKANLDKAIAAYGGNAE